ncbi:MAG: ribose 5-phosphate isomerase B [Clostridiales bacterium]|nr:ribose 5-phosphate isomerase B [Clostridiales bacterium]
MKIIIASDHGAYELKEAIRKYLTDKGFDLYDDGIYADTDRTNCHYPEIAAKAAKRVASGEFDYGIILCGTGIGVSITANKINGIRAAHVGCEYDARYTRLHNDANILCIGGRTMGEGAACEIAEIFLTTEFSHGERHQKRIDMIAALEK